ncbi:hypothetical protein JTE90_025964 [Oedothorax gibbosus]|uniref:Ionotropic glutamate receptor L-glutamate and glycine-binding domain-containing protein n=1 Tax=Oedothorax gibbosus TaxID=931172 RepID=A0AAV6U272_9ARAC|nr:hypothetical protein JTE90_025964 [Oedothorax gibbosus]
MKLRVVLPPLKDINEYKHVHKGIASPEAIDIRFMELIAQLMGFSYQLMLPVDGQFGVAQQNGNFTGIIGMIQRDEADLSVAHLAINIHRLQVVDFSETYWIEDLTFMTELSPLLPKTYFYTYPFSLGLWLAFLSVMIITTFFLLPGESVGTVLMTVLRGLSRQSVNERSAKTVSRKIMLIHWLWFTNYVTISYCAILLSFLTVPLRNKGVETIEDLCRAVKEGSYKALVPKGSFVLNSLLRSDNVDLREFGKVIKNNHWEHDTRKEIDNYFEYGTAVIGAKMKLSGVTLPRSFVSKDSFIIYPVAVALNRRFCCKKRLNVLLRKMEGAGLYQKIIDEERFKAKLVKQNFKSNSIDHQKVQNFSLSIDDLYGVFAMLMAGYIASGVALSVIENNQEMLTLVIIIVASRATKVRSFFSLSLDDLYGGGLAMLVEG